MPWSPPGIPVSGTTITVAFATALINTGLNWLRQLTGNGDPPAADYVAASTSTSTTTWQKVGTNLLDTAAVTDVKLANPKVNWTNPQYTTFGAMTDKGSGFFDAESTPGDGPVAALNWLVVQNRHWNHGADYRWQFTVNLNDSAQIWSRSVIGGVGSTWHRMFHSGMDGAGSGIDADTIDGVELVNIVPAGLIAAFRTAAAIASGWTRFTDGDGRLLVGAGTTFSVTFTENTAVGASWAHDHAVGSYTWGGTAPASGSASAGTTAGGLDVTSLAHTHVIAQSAIQGSSASTTWTPVGRVVVYAIKS